MALNYNYEKTSEAGKEWLRTDANCWHVCMLLMGVDMGGIRNAKDVKEFAFRQRCWNRVYGEATPLVPEAVIPMLVGLTTNVGYKSRAAFLKGMSKRLESEADRMGSYPA